MLSGSSSQLAAHCWTFQMFPQMFKSLWNFAGWSTQCCYSGCQWRNVLTLPTPSSSDWLLHNTNKCPVLGLNDRNFSPRLKIWLGSSFWRNCRHSLRKTSHSICGGKVAWSQIINLRSGVEGDTLIFLHTEHTHAQTHTHLTRMKTNTGSVCADGLRD